MVRDMETSFASVAKEDARCMHKSLTVQNKGGMIWRISRLGGCGVQSEGTTYHLDRNTKPRKYVDANDSVPKMRDAIASRTR
jgi:hypothetical protein